MGELTLPCCVSQVLAAGPSSPKQLIMKCLLIQAVDALAVLMAVVSHLFDLDRVFVRMFGEVASMRDEK